MAIDNGVAVALISGGGVAVGTGLVYLGWQLGRLRATMEAMGDRMDRVEDWQDDHDRFRVQAAHGTRQRGR